MPVVVMLTTTVQMLRTMVEMLMTVVVIGMVVSTRMTTMIAYLL